MESQNLKINQLQKLFVKALQACILAQNMQDSIAAKIKRKATWYNVPSQLKSCGKVNNFERF